MFSTPSLAQERNMDAAGPFPLWQWYKVISKNLTSPLLYGKGGDKLYGVSQIRSWNQTLLPLVFAIYSQMCRKFQS